MLEIEREILPPPAKRPTTESFFGDLFSAPSQRTDDELDSYLRCTEQCDDILVYWRQKVAVWPRLATIARHFLAIPATETSSERVFSLAGRTMEDRRSQLSVDAVDDLLFIHGLKKSKLGSEVKRRMNVRRNV